MKKLEQVFTVSYVTNVVLIMTLFLAAFYFFIGKNINYMAKTQNQINQEMVYFIEGLFSEPKDQVKKTDILELARIYNIGVSISAPDASDNFNQKVKKQELFLRLEFGGRYVTQRFDLVNRDVAVTLTYFRPYFTDDDTLKLIPVFFRLSLLLIAFTIIFCALAGKVNTTLVKADLNNIRDFVDGLNKGSSFNFSGKTNFAESDEVIQELSFLQSLAIKREELKKRLTSDLAHELRTPLTTLQTHLEALIDGVWQPTQERLNSCHEEIMRLIRLVGDLEKLSKIEDEAISLNKSKFNLTSLVKNIGVNFQGEVSQKSISLIIRGDEQIIKADKDKISQVFVNLLSNSLKYTPAKGKILIDISGDGQYVYVIFNDSGIGIPEKDLGNVFNRLYRTETSRARATGGAGIGLTIAKAIVEAHRGSIDIVSQEGLGTEISLILPC